METNFFKYLHPRRIWSILVPTTERPQTPREQFGAVFDVVQLSRVFPDSKTFVDMVPRKSPRRIITAYKKQYGTQLDISRFVRDNFIAPPDLPEPKVKFEGESVALQVRAFIDEMWDVLTREADHPNKNSSLLALPHRYIVPGGRFREIYYWDSYFTMLGLRENGKYDLMEEMVRNFAYLIDRYGFIPNGNRSYYISRSQPPMFALMVELLAEVRGEQVFEEYRTLIAKEYKYWMRGASLSSFARGAVNEKEHVVRMPDGEILNRYWDDSISPREESFIEDVEVGRYLHESADFYRNMRAGAESGWDYSSRWFVPGKGRESIRVTNIVPVDLNVLLYLTEDILSRIYQREGKYSLTKKYADLATARREAVQKYFWNEELGWFCDHIHSEKRVNDQPTIAGMFPLFGGVATAEQAAVAIEMVEEKFFRAGGVVTTLESTGEQWDAPNGWAPMQYVTVMGLERYGAHEQAEELAKRWCKLNIDVYERTGLLLEKYNVEDTDMLASGGEYALQDGFGWTNGVLLTLMNKYHINREVPEGSELSEAAEGHTPSVEKVSAA